MRLVRVIAALLAGALLLSGCDFDVYKLPLPGGTHVSDPMTVKAEFADVLDLVPKSTVKVNDVSVGQITDIKLEGQHAEVTMEIPRDTDLPDNAIAEIHQTSLLGEKFVALSPPPTNPSANKLSDGDVIPLDRTGRNPEVEEVLGALSLLLNGGGVAQLKTIADELNKVFAGRESTARDVIDQIREFVGQLDEHKHDIVHAIDSLDNLAVSVRHQQHSIDAALDELPSALVSINSQRHDLVKMLRALNHLGDVGVRVIQASKEGTIETLRQLDPVLTGIGNAGSAFVKSFNVFLTFPFVDEAVGRDPQVARNLQMGDYSNLSAELDIDLSGGISGIPTSLPTLLPSELNPSALVDQVTRCIKSGSLTSKACAKLLKTAQGLSKLKQACLKKDNEKTLVCRLLNAVPGAPNLGGSAPSAGASSGPLGGVLGSLGLNRTGIGPTVQAHGPTLRQLTRLFDPALVKLLVPEMVTTR